MRSYGRKSTFPLVLLFVGIFAFWWGISVLAQNDTAAPAPSIALPASASTADASQNISGPVALNITQKGTVYTYSGSLPVSSSCDDLGTGIAVGGDNSAHVTVLLTVTRPLIPCAETAGDASNEPFSASLSVASGTKPVLDGLTVNGVIVATNIQEIKTK
jgi:hypothetical protein